MTVSDGERAAMARARELGAGVLGTTSPNPPVGAVVLDAAGTPVGEGATVTIANRRIVWRLDSRRS